MKKGWILKNLAKFFDKKLGQTVQKDSKIQTVQKDSKINVVKLI